MEDLKLLPCDVLWVPMRSVVGCILCWRDVASKSSSAYEISSVSKTFVESKLKFVALLFSQLVWRMTTSYNCSWYLKAGAWQIGGRLPAAKPVSDCPGNSIQRSWSIVVYFPAEFIFLLCVRRKGKEREMREHAVQQTSSSIHTSNLAWHLSAALICWKKWTCVFCCQRIDLLNLKRSSKCSNLQFVSHISYWRFIRHGYLGTLGLFFSFQDSDLKQYLDNCGNLMSMYNVKVSEQRTWMRLMIVRFYAKNLSFTFRNSCFCSVVL